MTELTPQEEQDSRRVEQLRRIMGDVLCAVFEDSSAIEIMINTDGQVLVERHGEGITYLGVHLQASKVLNILNLMADYRGIIVNGSTPVVEGAMPPEFNKARFAGVIPPITDSPTLSIRLPARSIFTLSNYVEKGIITAEQSAVIEDALVCHKNILVSGSTSSGKSTLLNALLEVISRNSGLDERIIILEDTKELQCSAPNYVDMLTSEGIDFTRLLKLTLRYRPNRIIVGEVRDGAALALLKAWNTGHPGGLATLHANNPKAALLRLDQLCQEANVPPQTALVHEAVDIVIQIARDTQAPAGRRVTSIYDVKLDRDYMVST
jgi:type IV secretion system protein VirB11